MIIDLRAVFVQQTVVSIFITVAYLLALLPTSLLLLYLNRTYFHTFSDLLFVYLPHLAFKARRFQRNPTWSGTRELWLFVWHSTISGNIFWGYLDSTLHPHSPWKHYRCLHLYNQIISSTDRFVSDPLLILCVLVVFVFSVTQNSAQIVLFLQLHLRPCLYFPNSAYISQLISSISGQMYLELLNNSCPSKKVSIRVLPSEQV